LQDSKIRFRLQVESYISDWLFSELRLLASYVSCHKAMAYDTGMMTSGTMTTTTTMTRTTMLAAAASIERYTMCLANWAS
jgi:hypothetical protein